MNAHAILRAALTLLLLPFHGCSRTPVERIEWTTMGTVAAVQAKNAASADDVNAVRDLVRKVFSDVETRLNAHAVTSEISRLAPCADDEVLARCAPADRVCYATAFVLAKHSGNAFNPRWRGTKTLDLGAIAKGFAVDRAAERLLAQTNGADVLIDLGGNLKSVRGAWEVGIWNPTGEGLLKTVTLRPGEALATSATYFRGSHIYDGRTNRPVTNGVAAVTVRAHSAMLADGLSTTLFVLGPDEGRRLLGRLPDGLNDSSLAVLWVLRSGQTITFRPANPCR